MSLQLPRIRSVLVLANTRSGWKTAGHFWDMSLRQHLARAGIVSELRQIPPLRIEDIFKIERPENWDAVAIAGGDGTVSTIASQMMRDPTGWGQRPVLIVPSGTQNSIALSLGIFSPDDALEAFKTPKLKHLCCWNAFSCSTDEQSKAKDGNEETFMPFFAGLSIGTMAQIVRNARLMQLELSQSSSLPQIRRKFRFSMFREILWNASLTDCGISLKCGDEDKCVELPKPFRMCIMSQLSHQHTKFSLTPTASPKNDFLSVTFAGSEASRLRMLHLVLREARDAELLIEDGVSAYKAKAARVEVPSTATSEVVMLIDGETFVLEPGGAVEVAQGQSGISFFSL